MSKSAVTSICRQPGRLAFLLIGIAALLVAASSAQAQIPPPGINRPELVGIEAQPPVFPEEAPDDLPTSCTDSHRDYKPEPSGRAKLGLPLIDPRELWRQRDPRGRAEFGVDTTTAEYEQVIATLKRRSEVDFAEIRIRLSALGDGLIGAAWDMAGGDLVVYHSLPTDASEQIDEVLQGILPENVATTPTYVNEGVDWQTALRNTQTLEEGPDEWFDQETGIALGGLDESCGMLILYAQHEANLGELADSVAEVIERDHFRFFQLPEGYEDELSAKSSHHDPHGGGLQLLIEGNESSCTSNVPWRKGTEVFAVTAGHCVDNSSPGAADYFHVFERARQGWRRIDDGGLFPIVYVVYAGNIEAAVTRISVAASPTTHVGIDGRDDWESLNWWQWDHRGPNSDVSGDWVCHSGWGSRTLQCGTLNRRFYVQNTGAEDIFPGHNATFFNQRRSDADGCRGDSGGTFYRAADRTLTGLASRQFGSEVEERYENTCRTNTQYGHISYLRHAFGFDAPVGMN